MMEYKDLGEQISLLRRQQKMSQQILAAYLKSTERFSGLYKKLAQ